MKLRSAIREEEYATKTHSNNIDRDIKHAVLLDKHQKIGPNGQKVNISDFSYMQAV